MTSLTSIPVRTRHLVVTMLARAKSFAQIADASTLPIHTIQEIGAAYGAPDMKELAISAETLRRQLEIAEHAGTTPEPAVASAELERLIALSEQLKSARLINRGQWITAQIDKYALDVEAAVSARAQAEEAKAAAAEEKRAAQAEIAKLEKRIKTLRAKVSGKSSSTESAQIRAWAATQGISCPSHGRVPTAVRERYAEAHQ